MKPHDHAIKELQSSIYRYQGIKRNAQKWLKRNAVPARLEGWSSEIFRKDLEERLKDSIEKLEAIRKSMAVLQRDQC
jgi:hypothetical protein